MAGEDADDRLSVPNRSRCRPFEQERHPGGRRRLDQQTFLPSQPAMGFRLIRRATDKPIGMNVLIERSSKLYLDRMHRYLDVALEAGVRFFVTSLGNPRWVVDRVASVGGIVYHDVTERKWAEKGLAGGVHGLIAVNDRAGGHAGPYSAEALYEGLGFRRVGARLTYAEPPP